MTYHELLQYAEGTIQPCQLNHRVKVGSTVCVLETASGAVFVGKNLVAACALGYCAEQAAITEMLDRGENVIKSLLILDHEGMLLPPCGKCLELITQLCEKNRDATVYLDEGKSVTVGELLPLDWKRVKG